MFREWKNIGMSAAMHAIKFAVKVLYRYDLSTPGVHDFSCPSCASTSDSFFFFFISLFSFLLPLAGWKFIYFFLKRVCLYNRVKNRRTMTELWEKINFRQRWKRRLIFILSERIETFCCVKFWRIFRSFWFLSVSIFINRILAVFLLGKGFRFLKEEYCSLVILNIG